MPTRSESSRSVKQREPKQRSSTGFSYTDLDRLQAITDDEIDLSDAPEATEEWLMHAEVSPGKPIWIRQFTVTAPKAITEWFHSAPEGRDEAVLAALREYMDRHPRA